MYFNYSDFLVRLPLCHRLVWRGDTSGVYRKDKTRCTRSYPRRRQPRERYLAGTCCYRSSSLPITRLQRLARTQAEKRMNCSRPSVKHNEELILFYCSTIMRIWYWNDFLPIQNGVGESDVRVSIVTLIARKTVILRQLVLNPSGEGRARAERLKNTTTYYCTTKASGPGGRIKGE